MESNNIKIAICRIQIVIKEKDSELDVVEFLSEDQIRELE